MLTAFVAGLLLAVGHVAYHSPVDYPITLAGNFGEPRPNHFHGGLDIKTDNVEGKHIYAIGDGYVSRLTVGLYGFGNAVYVTHPEGYTSVYCHLQRFAPKLERRVNRAAAGKEPIDVRFTPLDFPVAQGQLIAISGNTGHSTGPHLHLEIHDTRTWHMLDPLDFVGAYVNDTVPPEAHSFMACPVPGEGVFCGGGGKQTFGFISHELDTGFTAWGKVGFALWADDYMQQVYNHYGIRETLLLVDGRVVFRADVGRIPVNSNRQVNAWGDYEHWLHHRTWYMRSWIPEGVTLPLLQADRNRGIVVFDEERPYRLEYVLRDRFGNESRYAFTVVGQRSVLSPVAPTRDNVSYDRLSLVSLPGMQLVIPVGMVAGSVRVCPKVEEGSGWSPRYTFSERQLPLFGWCELSIAVRRPVSDPSRLYISGGGRDLGGVYQDGWLTTAVRELGVSYEVKYREEN